MDNDSENFLAFSNVGSDIRQKRSKIDHTTYFEDAFVSVPCKMSLMDAIGPSIIKKPLLTKLETKCTLGFLHTV